MGLQTRTRQRFTLPGLAEMFTHIFAEMTDRGLILRDDPAIPVFTCTAPIFAHLQIARKK